jgi:hypothetical protein
MLRVIVHYIFHLDEVTALSLHDVLVAAVVSHLWKEAWIVSGRTVSGRTFDAMAHRRHVLIDPFIASNKRHEMR